MKILALTEMKISCKNGIVRVEPHLFYTKIEVCIQSEFIYITTHPF